MKPLTSGRLGAQLRAFSAVGALLALGWGPGYTSGAQSRSENPDTISNGQTFRNASGRAATFSTQGAINTAGEYFQAQGSNGRSCATCHTPEDGWSITPATLQRLFDETEGGHPVFHALDANNPDVIPTITTVEERMAAYGMLLSRGVFRRGGPPRANAEWELIAADDPHGFASLSRLVHWRRPLPTINFPLGNATVNWDGGNSVGTDQRAGLLNQAARNITGGQQGPPAPPDVLDDIVDFETSLFTAQVIMHGVGRLDSDGARGGPEAMATMTRVSGRFDLFDAWTNHENPRRAQIARGQELFNNVNAGGGRCSACHDSANDGSNTRHLLFDVGAASATARTPDLPLYTFRNRTTGAIRQLTDAGRGNITGLWNDLGRFKTPTIRGLSSRAPYFHNGIAATLEEVVRHYETHLDFVFTDEERAALVAFLSAL
jgi:cytochrome c peroxidase